MRGFWPETWEAKALKDTSQEIGRPQERWIVLAIVGLLGPGLTMPGPIDVDSMSFAGPTTLEGWRGYPVEQRLADVSRAPSFNAAGSAAAAFGERLRGAQ